MPAALVVLLGVLAVAYLHQALTGRASDAAHDPDESPLPGRRARFLYLVAGLAVMLLLTPLAGIGPACVAAFVLVARAFDSRRLLRDVLVACVFVFVIWYVFDRLLGVQLGPFTSLIPRF
jgi:putative tricarboxylic transport membrane protein